MRADRNVGIASFEVLERGDAANKVVDFESEAGPTNQAAREMRRPRPTVR